MTPHVVITGASSGLGAALARRYAAGGSALSLFGRDVARLSEIADDCRRTAADVATYAIDVTDAPAMSAALGEIQARNPVDILIANAGVGGGGAMASSSGESLGAARRIADVNFIGVINTVVPLAEAMTTRGTGRIAIISSIAGLQGLAESPVYSASKAAVRIYGESLRRLLGARGVSVTVVVPGFITTPMAQSLPFDRPFEWSADKAAARIVRGVERREAEIVFPWQLALLSRAIGWLPRGLGDRALALGRIWTGHRA